MNSKPTVTKESELFRAKYSSTVIRQYQYPNGAIHDREIVCCSNIGVVVVPQLPDGRLICIRQYRHAPDDFFLEFPAGLMDPGESPIETARRELEEEAGYRTENLTLLGSFYTSPGFTDEKLHVVFADGLTLSKSEHMGDELILGLSFFTVEEAFDLVGQGAFKNGPSVAALMFAIAKGALSTK